MTKITSKGQVTVPKSIRDYPGLKPGSAVILRGSRCDLAVSLRKTA